MSLVDDVFGSIPTPLIDQWGVSATYIKVANSEQVYDPATGTFETPVVADTRVTTSVIPLNVAPDDVNGEIRITDTKFLIPASHLGDYFPKPDDCIEYAQAELIITAKIITALTHRGSRPILHSVIGRSIMAVDTTDPTQLPERAREVKEVRVDTDTQGVIYVGRGVYGLAESSVGWTITRTTYNIAGVRQSKGTATGVTWTGRAGHTYT